MAGAQYLYRRASGIYCVRLCVPSRLRDAVGKGELHRTTGCRDLRLAKIVCHGIASQWHETLKKLEHMDPSKIVAGSLDLLGEGTLPLSRAAALLGTDVGTLAAELENVGAAIFVEAEDWDGWLLDDIWQLEHVHDVAGLREVVINETSLSQLGSLRRVTQRLAFRFTAEAVRVAGSVNGDLANQFMVWPSRERAFVVPHPGRTIARDHLLVMKSDVEALRERLSNQVTPAMLEHAATITARPADGDSMFTICLPRHARMPLSELVAKYLDSGRADWRPNTLHMNSDRCNALVELLGDPPLSDIERTRLLEWAELVKRLPADRQKVRTRFKVPEATFKALIQLADDHERPRVTPSALEKIVGGAAEFFSWAHRQRYFRESPAERMAAEVRATVEGRRAKAQRASEARELFSPEELRRIFDAEWFRTGTGARTRAGKFFAYRPHYYWLPLLALYAGGRINELSQLYLHDLHFEGAKHPYIHFNLQGAGKLALDDEDGSGTSDKSLKSVSSERKTPIHPMLLQLGLPAYTAALREAGHIRLFPELKHDPVKGYGKAAGRWFNERFLGRGLGIERDGTKTFHSLRHHFATALGVADVSTSTKSQLMGHSVSSELVDKRYDKGKTVDQLVASIVKIEHHLPFLHPMVIADAIQAIADALKLKGAHRTRLPADSDLEAS